jgi:hypothetical protein
MLNATTQLREIRDTEKRRKVNSRSLDALKRENEAVLICQIGILLYTVNDVSGQKEFFDARCYMCTYFRNSGNENTTRKN